eukprot:c40919_g1_i1 orf=185-397(-)
MVLTWQLQQIVASKHAKALIGSPHLGPLKLMPGEGEDSQTLLIKMSNIKLDATTVLNAHKFDDIFLQHTR